MARRPGAGQDDEPDGHRRPGPNPRGGKADRLPGNHDRLRLRERPARLRSLRPGRPGKGHGRDPAAERKKDREGERGRGPTPDRGGTMSPLVAALVLSLQTFPPKLPDGKEVVTDTSEEFLKPGATLKSGVAVAKAAPTIDFMYFPGQDYAGKPWSNWGDSIAVGGKYYASIG